MYTKCRHASSMPIAGQLSPVSWCVNPAGVPGVRDPTLDFQFCGLPVRWNLQFLDIPFFDESLIRTPFASCSHNERQTRIRIDPPISQVTSTNLARWSSTRRTNAKSAKSIVRRCGRRACQSSRGRSFIVRGLTPTHSLTIN